MKRIIRYRVRPENAAENEALIRAVFEQLRREAPSGLHYATFKLDDGVTFVHVVSLDGDADPLPQLEAFKAFATGVRARCDEPPVVQTLHEVGSYRVFDP